MPDKPSLIWHSNSPTTSTGYGSQTALFIQRIRETYNVVVSSYYGVEGNIIPWNGIPILPGIGQTFGDQTIQEHAGRIFDTPRDGLVLTLMDVWVLNPHIWSRFNTCSWVPVDHQPAPEPVKRFFQESGVVPIAMSRFGEKELEEFDPIYVPHGVDTRVYKPIDKDEAREATGMPKDAFIVGMVAANKGNPSRKCFSEAFQAFKVLHDKHPDSKLYLHTELSGRFDGVDLPRLAHAIGIPEKALIACDQYRAVHYPLKDDQMANVYSSLDVLLSPSAGEGFGVPVIEAQACGVPVIVSDFSAQPELVGAGWTVEGRKVYTPISSWQFAPDVDDIADALRQAHARDLGDCKERAVTHAAQYDADLVATKYLLPALEEVQKRYDQRAPLKVAA